MADAAADNGKVTMAVLATKLDALTAEVHAFMAEMRSCNAAMEQRLRFSEAWNNTSQERWRQHEEDHRDINVKNRIGDWAAYIAAAIAAAVGVGVKSP